MSNEHPSTEHEQRDRESQPPRDGARPDLRGPRGNQEVEQVDVDRGREKIERVLTK